MKEIKSVKFNDSGNILKKVVRRNGEVVDFELSKISKVIYQAFVESNRPISLGECTMMAKELEIYGAEERTADEIQDEVENYLIKNKYIEVVKSTIRYRKMRELRRVIQGKQAFIREYSNAINPASGSKLDANANIETKNIATLSGELNKRENILVNRAEMVQNIGRLYGIEMSTEYIRQLEAHEIYKHDETSIKPYCVSINMYPFLKNGLQDVGGLSSAPKNLHSFAGSFINLVFIVASQFAGAVATPEFLMYMDYYIRKDFGDDYYLELDETLFVKKGRNHKNVNVSLKDHIESYFQQIVYSLNQPAAARDFQSVFWNIGYFDSYYFDSMFGGFWFPDGTQPKWESLDAIQRLFMKWFNKERLKSPLTFPVETMAMLTEAQSDGTTDIKDKEYADLTSEMYAEGHSFFTYTSESADSLASCCRLRNEISGNDFSYSLGAGGVATGSKSVITMNLNRLVQNAVRKEQNISDVIREQVKKIHKYQIAYNEIIKSHFRSGLLPVYDAGFIKLEKQFLTIGVNGMVEAAEFMGIEVKADNKEYQEFIDSILKPIYEENKLAKTGEIMFNTEFVPAENLGVKHANWDREDGYFVPRDCYNSYFYVVEDNNTNILDKFKLHGRDSVKYLDGGSALHMNLEEHLSKEQYRQLLRVAATDGVNYFTFNVPNTICNSCGHISKHKLSTCPECGGENLDYLTRIIGYLKRVSSFSEARQVEHEIRYYSKKME